MGLDPAEEYGRPFVEATLALEMYEKRGHGRFLWLAYQAMRRAEAAWPDYATALRAKGAASVARLGKEGVEPIVEAAELNNMRDRILRSLDPIVEGLLGLDAVSGPSGAAALRTALRIDGSNSPTSSMARDLEQKIIEAVQFTTLRLLNLQDLIRVRNLRLLKEGKATMNSPPASAEHLFRTVASAFRTRRGRTQGETITTAHVRKVWGAFITRELDHPPSHWNEIFKLATATKGATPVSPAP